MAADLTSASARAWAGERYRTGRGGRVGQGFPAVHDDEAAFRGRATVEGKDSGPAVERWSARSAELVTSASPWRVVDRFRRGQHRGAGWVGAAATSASRAARRGRTLRGRAAPCVHLHPGLDIPRRRTPSGWPASPLSASATAICLRTTPTGSPDRAASHAGVDPKPWAFAASTRSASATQAAYWASARARSRASRCRPLPMAAGVLPAGSSASISQAQSASVHTTPKYHATTTGKPPRLGAFWTAMRSSIRFKPRCSKAASATRRAAVVATPRPVSGGAHPEAEAGCGVLRVRRGTTRTTPGSGR